MKKTVFRFGPLAALLLATVLAFAAPTTVRVQDTLYDADGNKAGGRITITWSRFTAPDGSTIDGGAKNYTIPSSGTDAGLVDLYLVPNTGATPSGTSYKAQYFLVNGASYTETWVVPAAGPVTISDIRVSIVPVSAATYLAMLNGLITATQTFATGTAGSDFGISSSAGTHTFNLPTASATKRGLLSAEDWTAFNSGSVTLTFSDGLTRTVNNVACDTASAGQLGCLSAADWSTFNAKAPTTSPTFATSATFSFLTAGSIPFAGNGGLLSQDNSNLFWDNTNKRLGVGTTTPSYTLHVVGGSLADLGTVIRIQSSMTTSHALTSFYASGLTEGEPVNFFNISANDSEGVERQFAGIGMVPDSITAGAFTGSLQFRTANLGAYSAWKAKLTGPGHFIPASASSQNLGASDTRWNLFGQTGNFAGKVTLAASATGSSSLNIPSGTAPNTPVSGDFWNLSGVPQFYNGSATKSLAFLDSNISGTAAGLSSTLGLSSGGTNATSWTAARCVRVNAGGTALESAAADCGAGAGDVTAVGDCASGDCYQAATANYIYGGPVTGAAAPAALRALVSADIPANAADTSGTAATATALAADPAGCTADGLNFTNDINASGTSTCANVRTASDAQTGVAELATQAETAAGTDTGRTITPSGIAPTIQSGSYLACADAGASDAYACATVPVLSAYTTGMQLNLKANTANTGAATVQVGALAVIPIKKLSGGITTVLADNDIRAGQWTLLVYDGTNFQMQGQTGTSLQSADVPAITTPTDYGMLYYRASTPPTILSTVPATAGYPILDGGVGVAPAPGQLNLAGVGITGVLPNGNTTAASTNTINTIVLRDGSGNFSAGTITAALTGNVSGSSGSTTGNAATATELAADPANCAAGELAAGVNASGTAEGCQAFTDANTASAVVQRDASGDFSAHIPTFSGITAGSVLFAGTAGLLSQDNANLFWDNTAKRLGVGTAAPLLKLDVAGSGRFTGAATSVLTGSIDPAASTAVVGVGTLFVAELAVGDRITVTGETRTVTAITDNLNLTVDTAFSNNANDTSPDKLSAVFIGRISDGTVKAVVNDLGYMGLGTVAPTSQLTVGSPDSSALTDFLINPTLKTSGKLLDLQVGGVSKLFVDYTGGALSAVGYTVGTSAQYGGTVIAARSNWTLYWKDGASIYAGNTDLGISRISAGVLGVGTGAQGSVAGTVQATTFLTSTADPADAGVLRLANGEQICWEASPTGTDFCITGDSSGRIAATTFVGALTGNAATATALTADPAGCTANGLNFTNDINASGVSTCADVRAASDSQTGVAEAAIASEVNTGTDAARYVSPDALAGSNLGVRLVQILVTADYTTATTIADGQAYFDVPVELNGMNLVSVRGKVITVGTDTGVTDVDLARCAVVNTGSPCSGTVDDMLSTNLTIDQNEEKSDTAATPAVIDTAHDDIATGQTIRVDVDAIVTGVAAAKGLIVTLGFQLP